MIEMRIHGRGGQGSVLASQVLSTALFREGQYVQSFASYGGERRGAPVAGYVRVDDAPIFLRCDVQSPGYVLVLDETMLDEVDITGDLPAGATIVINSVRPPTGFPQFAAFHVATVDALAIAGECGLGRIVNTAMIGAFGGATRLVSVETLAEVVRELSPREAEANVAACVAGYQRVQAPVRQ